MAMRQEERGEIGCVAYSSSNRVLTSIAREARHRFMLIGLIKVVRGRRARS